MASSRKGTYGVGTSDMQVCQLKDFSHKNACDMLVWPSSSRTIHAYFKVPMNSPTLTLQVPLFAACFLQRKANWISEQDCESIVPKLLFQRLQALSQIWTQKYGLREHYFLQNLFSTINYAPQEQQLSLHCQNSCKQGVCSTHNVMWLY